MRNSINYQLDESADVLYASFGKPIPSVCEEIAGGVLVRKSLMTGEITGFTIINYIRQLYDGFLDGVFKDIPELADIQLPDYRMLYVEA